MWKERPKQIDGHFNVIKGIKEPLHQLTQYLKQNKDTMIKI